MQEENTVSISALRTKKGGTTTRIVLPRTELVGIDYSLRCGATRAATRFRSDSSLAVTANNENLKGRAAAKAKDFQTSYYPHHIAGDKRLFHDKEQRPLEFGGLASLTLLGS